ncbi:MAG: RelA/SpoT family protein [Gammaproteobacteria bacterium]
MTNIVALQRKIGAYLPPAARAEIADAYAYSKNAHLGQVRASGRPYIQHPLTVADILADWRFDAQSIIAALLHDVVEDTPVSLPQVRDKFGGAVARLVGGLSKIERIEGIDRRAQEAETFRKILLAAADDWRVLFIKLADRLHNMRTLSAIGESSRRRRIALETLTIYAPIAERLGFYPVRDELQNLSFRYLRPHRYRVLSKALNNSKAGHRHVIERVEAGISAALEKRGISGALEKRRKNLHSIYQKMEKRRLTFAQVEDIVGFRLIVADRMQCYLALGALHEAFMPLPGRFTDYIATKKSNGYQSLHTALQTREGVKVEIQIRTREMHEIAESGLAAHWTYKQPDAKPDAAQTEALSRLSSLLRMHAENDAPGDFMEYLRVELSPGEIYVLTPEGEAMRLPPDSTALDFAYAIHTDVGDRAEGAVVNGANMPLSRRLQSGDQVSVRTNPDIRPMPHWLGIAKTARARSHIRHILNEASRGDSAALGRKLLEGALQRIHSAPEEISDDHWGAFLRSHNMENAEELHLSLGLGKMLPDIVARELLRRQARRGRGQNARIAPVAIAGAGNAAITLSPCCHPLPFESIVGVLRKNRGLEVHADKCPAVRMSGRRSEKWIETAWSDRAIHGAHRSAILLECRNNPGLASAVSSAIGGRDINIVKFNFNRGESSRDSIQMETIVEVPSLAELNRLLRALRLLPDVIDARRDWREPRKTTE